MDQSCSKDFEEPAPGRVIECLENTVTMATFAI